MRKMVAIRCDGRTWHLLNLLRKVQINNKNINPLINERL